MTRTAIKPSSSVGCVSMEYSHAGSLGSSEAVVVASNAVLLDRLGGGDAGGDFGQLAFAKQLGVGQIASDLGVLQRQAARLAQHGDRPGENGQGQNHFQQGESRLSHCRYSKVEPASATVAVAVLPRSITRNAQLWLQINTN